MLVPLGACDENLILAHYLRLSPEDRYLRFFNNLSDYAITQFVTTQMDLADGVAFGIMVDGALVGVAYVGKTYESSGRDTAEAGFSIDLEHRGEGHASLLMSAIIGYCRGARIQTLVMSCLRENTRMQKIARNFGLRVVVERDEAYADLNFPGRKL
jgi:RimJ/RimL family protein N-acetyltransferase